MIEETFDRPHCSLSLTVPLRKIGAAGRVFELVVFGELGKFSGGVLRAGIRDESLWDAMVSKDAFQMNDDFGRSRTIETSYLDVS